MSTHEDEEKYRRDYHPGYNTKHRIPTVQQYREFKQDQKANLSADQPVDVSSEKGGGHQGAGLNRWFSDTKGNDQSPEQSAKAPGKHEGKGELGNQSQQTDSRQEGKPDTSQTSTAATDPKARRKQLKNRDVDQAEREVTDPITHLPVNIRDYSEADLQGASEGDSATQNEVSKSGQVNNKLSNNYDQATTHQEEQHEGMQKSFPPPSFQIAKHELATIYSRATNIALGTLVALSCLSTIGGVLISSPHLSGTAKYSLTLLVFAAIGGTGFAITTALSGWVESKAKQTWDDTLWEAQRLQEKQDMAAPEPEPTKWLNKIFGSIWPLVNPDLFASLVDTLEDVMQASLPKMVRMVSVEDLGQGSEALRFLGIKWLPRGAAAETVNEEGDSAERDGQRNPSGDDAKDDNEELGALEAEEGDFVNLEMAFAYRSSREIRNPRDREKNAHLYMAFYLPGGIKLPVWVELKGLVGSVRMRLQLTPDPPFIALATITFMGQPKVEILCTPLLKGGLNIMDVPLISNFVQSAVDAAVNQYVAPKSLILDVKSMISGDDFKHDTRARGIIVVRIHHAFDFKASDMRVPGIRKGSSDPYVSVGWAKFGKPLYSTRVLVDNMEPYWEEGGFLTVAAEELDAEEALRLQLWDSDKTSADDDLGRIEVDLKELMRDERSKGKMWKRVDAFRALNAGEDMPGKLEWSVGYYSKVRLMDSQVAHQSPKDDINTVEQLKADSYHTSKQKLREANRDLSSEADQLMKDDFETTSTDMVTSSIPSSTYPSGILSFQIHQIQGLEFERQSKTRATDGGEPDEAEEETGEHLPDSYCTVILNHQKIFKTRTKPKNSKPFFNAGTERFIRDWRSTSIVVSVRDARVHEDDPLLGFVLINLGDLLHERHTSRLCDFFPICGGIGYGRIRISLVFRSVQMQPLQQQLGWDWGTVEVGPQVTTVEDLPSELRGCRIKVRTQLGKGRLHSSRSASKEAMGDMVVWQTRKDRPIYVPVRKRYSASLIFEFRSNRLLLPDQSPAYAILWLQNIPDEEDLSLDLPVFRGDLKRAEANVLPEDKNGEKVGSIRVKIRFWRGLGRWHGRIARQNPEVANVMESLVAARDNGLAFQDGLVGDSEWLAKRRKDRAQAGGVGGEDDGDSDGSSDSEDSDSDDFNGKGGANAKTTADGDQTEATVGSEERENTGKSSAEADGSNNSGGLIDEIKGYKRNKDQLHRRHRGIMQWKGPRTINWLKNKAEHTADRITDSFHHHDREPGIETEV